LNTILFYFFLKQKIERHSFNSSDNDNKVRRSVVTAVLLCTQMMKHVDDDPDYSDTVRQRIVVYDTIAFINARNIVARVRQLYIVLYNHICHSWDQLDRPVGDHPLTGMHG